MQPTNDRALVSIYRSSRKAEMYLYVPKVNGMNDLPEALLEQFGKPHHVMDFLLTRDKKLARADSGRVLDNLMERGFYLQMPPSKDEYLRDPQRDAAPGRNREA